MSHRDTPELRDGQELTAQSARETPRTEALNKEIANLPDSVQAHRFYRHAVQLEIELSQERERGRWIPVSKKLPEEGATVLAFWHPMSGGPPTGQSWGVTTYCPGHWHNPEDDEDDYATPSHWQPLPSAPK
jgi:hypothetical protein